MTTILHAKKIIYDNYGEFPPMLSFIGIDTDGAVYNKWLEARDGSRISLETSEQLRISVPNPAAIYGVGRAQNRFGWIAPGNENALTVLDRGAGQIRSNGRFAITENENNVREFLRGKINQISNVRLIDNQRYESFDASIDVHVVFSLSGGTGGGTFINFAYLVKDILPGCKISGYAVMGGVFRAMFNGAAVARVLSNSYGAIKDLDYLMGLGPTSNVNVEFFNGMKGVNCRPFNALYLIDNRNMAGDTYTTVDQISEMISLALVTSIGQLGNATEAVADNVDKHIADGDMDAAGKRAWVAGLGVSEIVYDGVSLARIYANKARAMVISLMTNGGCDDPSCIANNWIDSNGIRENKGRDDVIDYFASPQPGIPFTDIDNPDNPGQECDNYINNLSQEDKEIADEKLEKLKSRVNESLHSLIESRINVECGAYLCENILKALLMQFELCDGEMKNEIDNLNRNDLPLKKSALETSQKELEDFMGKLIRIGKPKKVQSVCDDAVSVAVCLREIKRREYARQFYAWLMSEVRGYIHGMDTMLSNLRAVTERSTRDTEALRRGIDNNSFFQHNLAISMVDSVSCQKKDIVFNDFVKWMEEKGGLWTFAALNSDQVAQLIWEFTWQLPETRNYRNQSVDNVLGTLTDVELDRVCNVAIRKAQPLLRTDYRGHHPILSPDDSYYVGVADIAGSVLNRNNFFMNRVPEPGANVNVVAVGLKDRVIIFHQFSVVPAFAVSAIDNFESEYEERERVRPGTSHWDFGLYQRFAAEHFDIMPRNEVKEEEIIQRWVQALMFGIVTKNGGGEFFIKSRELGGRAIEQFRVRMGRKRLDAYNCFAQNLSVIKMELDRQVNEIIQNNRALPNRLKERFVQEVNEGVYHLPGHLSLNDIDFGIEENCILYKEEYDQLDKETQYISSM